MKTHLTRNVYDFLFNLSIAIDRQSLDNRNIVKQTMIYEHSKKQTLNNHFSNFIEIFFTFVIINIKACLFLVFLILKKLSYKIYQDI
jgi:hypothetical protein